VRAKRKGGGGKWPPDIHLIGLTLFSLDKPGKKNRGKKKKKKKGNEKKKIRKGGGWQTASFKKKW